MRGKLTCHGLGACRAGGAHAASMPRGLVGGRQGPPHPGRGHGSPAQLSLNEGELEAHCGQIQPQPHIPHPWKPQESGAVTSSHTPKSPTSELE